MEEMEITIDRAGRVRVHLRGVKGRACAEYAKWLAAAVGREASRELTSEYWEPEGKVRLDVEGRQGG